VDAIIKLGDRLLPIDAKFPLEAYERLQKEPDNEILERQFSQTLRKHIDDIAVKYIRPAEKTLDFAVMYIPAEAVYFQLVTRSPQNTFEYALSKRVIPSSPGQIYAFLATVAALHAEVTVAGLELSESSRQIRAGIEQLAETTARLARFHNRMEGSLRALTVGFDKARTELDQIRLQVEKLRQPFGQTSEGASQEHGVIQSDSPGTDHAIE
jgi:DNA recombination protein RmuC